jgi:hypothetical protein
MSTNKLSARVRNHPQEPLSLLDSLLQDGGSFQVKKMPLYGTIGVAHLRKRKLVMLCQGERESMFAFLCRMEHALAAAIISGEVVDEVSEAA